MKPLTVEQVIRRGRAAAQLLADETVMGALGDVEAELVTEWAASNPLHADAREDMYRMVRALEMLQRKLESYKQAGEIEQYKIEQAERDAKEN